MVIITHGGNLDKALQQQREFYELLGRAVSQWSYIEDQVYHTYRCIIVPGDLAAAAAAYHSILNMNTRLDMVEAGIAVSKKYKPYLEEWTKLRKKIRKQSARRARLAHWTVIQDSTQPDEQGVTMYLHPPTYDFGRYNEDGEREKVTASMIGEWASAFTRLGRQIENFWRQLS